jgi:hypothetical protein
MSYSARCHENVLSEICIKTEPNYSQSFLTWPFSTECAVDKEEFTNRHKDCRIYMGYNRSLVTVIPQCSCRHFSAICCYISPVLLMRSPEARLKHSLYIPSHPRRPQSQYSVPRELRTCHSLPSIMQYNHCLATAFQLLLMRTQTSQV